MSNYNYEDILNLAFPQQQAQQLSPLEQYLLMQEQMQAPSVNDPNIQAIGAASPERYVGQNMNSALNNAQDYQTALMGRQLDTAQALQGQQNTTFDQGIAERGMSLKEQQFAQENPNYGSFSSWLIPMLDPDILSRALNHETPDPEAMQALWKQVATISGQTDKQTGEPIFNNTVFQIMNGIAEDPSTLPPEVAQQVQAEQAAQEEGASNFLDYAKQTDPRMANAVRMAVANSADPDRMMGLLAANRGNRDAATAAAGYASVMGDKMFRPAPAPGGALPATGGEGGPVEGGPGWLGPPGKTVAMGSPTLSSVAQGLGGMAYRNLLPNPSNPLGLARNTPGGLLLDLTRRGLTNTFEDERRSLGGMIFGRGNQGVTSSAVKATPAQLEAMKTKNKTSPPPKKSSSPTSTTFHK